MMSAYLKHLTILGFCTLSACGSTGMATTEPPPEGNAKFQLAYDKTAALGIEQENVDTVTADELPNTASMSGFAGFQSEEHMILGLAEANIDFQGGTIDGTASDFTDFELSGNCEQAQTAVQECFGDAREDLAGSLDIAGTVAGTSYDISAVGQLDGNLAGQAATVDVDFNDIGDIGRINGNLMIFALDDEAVEVTWDAGGSSNEYVGAIYLEQD